MKHIDYQVLAPDSVAWFIQAALVADRTGNTHTRDLALAEARRIAAERRLVEQPAPDGSRVLCYDCRTNGERLDDLEARMEEVLDTLSLLSARIDNNVDALASRIAYLERHAQGITGPDAGL
jgi:hypothetical protein